MSRDPPHRKRVRHYDDPGDFHELTFSCYRRMPLLTNDLWRGKLSESIDRGIARHGYRLAAFIYMPEHVHLLVYPGQEAGGVLGLLRAIKRPYSYRIKRLLVAGRSPLLEELTVRQRPGVKTFRYWQEGPGYDRNLTVARTILSSVDYIHDNPVRRGLCVAAVQWQWSSVRHYAAEHPPEDPLLPRSTGCHRSCSTRERTETEYSTAGQASSGTRRPIDLEEQSGDCPDFPAGKMGLSPSETSQGV